MENWIISANPYMYDHASSFEHFSYIDWRQGKNKFQVGDCIYIYTTRPISTVQYKCVIEKIDLQYPNLRDDKEYWKNEEEYKKSINGNFMRLRLINQLHNPKLGLAYLLNNGLNGPPQGPVKLRGNLLKYINSNFSENFQTEVFPETINEEAETYEGLKKQVIVNRYERSSIAREKCIEFHGVNCKVCSLDFFSKYGPVGSGFIHIHHVIPLHLIGKEYKVNYQKDLIPVCPNCHSMLHRKIDGKEPTVEELKQILKKNKTI